MTGRDVDEPSRSATPLELLFDLTFATSFGIAATHFAGALAHAHYAPALLGFGLASLAICWAWVNFTWFASAYDTDDWAFRIATMVQMTGVLVLAIGLAPMFRTIGQAPHLDAGTMVLGYVVMRGAMVFQWLRAARQDTRRRRACLVYAGSIALAQAGWVAWVLADVGSLASLAIFCLLWAIEFSGPLVAERLDGGTPWHARHVADRYSCFTVIALGEAVVGTAAVLSAVIDRHGWSRDAALVCVAGIGLTFGIWWIYYLLPSAEVLHEHRARAFVWSYLQMLLVASIVAVGAGLRVSADFVARSGATDALATVLAVAVPTGLFTAIAYGLYHYLVPGRDRLHGWLLAATLAVLAGAVVAAHAGIDMALSLLVVTLAPVVTVVGYERLGYRRRAMAAGGSHPPR